LIFTGDTWAGSDRLGDARRFTVPSIWAIESISPQGIDACHGDPIMNAAVQLDQDALAAFCQKWRIRELSLFGSALREDFRPDSDLDFLVSFEPDASWDLFDLVTMKDELKDQYGREIDLVEKEALRNPWRKYEILRTREVIYAA
jgi:hypothetical protein